MSRFRKMTSGPEAAVCLASMFNSSLGVRHGSKCIVDGDKELFLRSASLVLQNLDIEHPVGQYLVNTCQSFHKRHGSGVKTLLFLIGSLMKMAVSQREKAIPVCDIMSAMEEGVMLCQKVMEEVKLPLSDIILSCDQSQRKIPPPGSDDPSTHREAVLSKTDVDQGVDHCSRDVPVTDHWVVKQIPQDIQDIPTNTPTNTPTDIPAKSHTSSLSPLDTEDMVKLTLKENNANHEEDLDWFFEDDPFIQGHDFKNYENFIGFPRPDFLGNKTSDPVRREVENKTHCHSDDSDFDDCFDDIPKIQKFELTVSDSINTRTPQPPVCNKSSISSQNSFDFSETRNIVPDLLLPGRNCLRQESTGGDVEDEFDSCFDVEYDKNKRTGGTFLNGGQPRMEGQQIKGQCPSDRSKSASDSQSGTRNLDMKLQDILKGKTKSIGQKHSLVYNSSRHFKMVESTVDIHIENESNTDPRSYPRSVAHSNHENLGQSVTSQGQGRKNQSKGNFIHNQACSSSDKTKSINDQTEISVNKRPAGNMEDKLDTKSLDTTNPGSEGLRRKLDILLEKAKSQKVSGAVLQSRHFREIGQTMDDIEKVQRSEVKNLCTKKEKTCSEGLVFKSENKVTSRAYHMSEVKGQEQDVPLQPGQRSKVKTLDRTSSQNEKEMKMCTQMTSDLVGMTAGSGVVSEHVSINKGMVCTCMARPEVDRWAGLRGVARNLSHCDEDMMDILVEAAMSQWRTEGGQDINQARLTLDLLYCCVTLGPLTLPELVSGVVMAADGVNLPLVHQYKGRQLHTIMINGDIKPSYHHLGYKRALDVEKTMTAEDFLQADGQSSWLSDVAEVLHKFSVTCLLVRGSICDEVKVMCETFRVIAVENVPYKALHVMCTATVTSMTTYLSMADRTNVCTSVSLDTYKEERVMVCQTNLVKVTCHNTPVQTCVISHPTRGAGDLMEQDFWRCANILWSLLSSGHVLPGGGRAEQLCCQALLSSSAAVTQDDDLTSNHHLPHVLQDMAAVLHDYYITINLNRGQGHSDPPPIRGHSDSPPIRGHADPPLIGGHTDPPLIGHADPSSKGHLDPLMNRADLGPDNHSKDVHHVQLPSNIDKPLPSCMDTLDTMCDKKYNGSLPVIFDDYKSKLASIQTACDFVGTVLMCDSYIVTGVDQTPDLGHATDFLSRHLYDVIL